MSENKESLLDEASGEDTGDNGGGNDAGDNQGDSSGEASSWLEGLDSEYRDNPSLKDIPDLNTLAKNYINTKGMVGKKFAPPPEDASDAEWNEFYERMGRPEKADAYGLESELLDAQELQGLQSKLFAAGLNKKQAQAVMDGFADFQVNKDQAQVAADKESISKAKAELLTKYGDEQRVKDVVDQVKVFAKNTFPKEFIDSLTDATLSNGTSLANDPQTIITLYELSNRLGEDSRKLESTAVKNEDIEAKYERALLEYSNASETDADYKEKQAKYRAAQKLYNDRILAPTNT